MPREIVQLDAGALHKALLERSDPRLLERRLLPVDRRHQLRPVGKPWEVQAWGAMLPHQFKIINQLDSASEIAPGRMIHSIGTGLPLRRNHPHYSGNRFRAFGYASISKPPVSRGQ